jgi:hypothetical protein
LGVVATTLHASPLSAEPLSTDSLLADLVGVLGTVRHLVHDASPGCASGDQAVAVVELLTQIQRVASSGIALFAPVVVETGSFAKSGHGSAADWLGALSGSSAGAAKGLLVAADQAAFSPRLTEALHEGELSTEQLKVVTLTGTEVKGSSTEDLLGLIGQGASHKELIDAAAQRRAAHRSKETERFRRARVHDNRHLRWRQDEHGGIRFEGSCDEVAWAGVAPRLEAEAKARWKADGSGGDSLEAHRLDAFIDLMSGAAVRESSVPAPAARPRTLVIIDAAALRRGTTEGDELCEIEGIGTVSVGAATELIGTGGLQYLVKEGFDITTVTKSSRAVAHCIDMALLVRDRVCAVPGCGKRLGLERDHWRLDYGDDGPTELANLVRLCPEHHHMKTHGGWSLTGGPGHWHWVGPPNPPSAGFINRSRKVAAQKARAGVIGDRNRPRRT